MSGISSYIFRQIGGPLLFFTFVLTGVVWLSQSLRMLDLVINQSQSALTYLYLTMLALPQLMALILPFALFCAVLYSLNRLYVESELVVIWAAGFSRWAVAGPVLVIAVAATLVGYLFSLVVMPAGMREMKDRVFEIRADLVNTFVREGAFTNPISGLTVYVSQNSGGDIRGILVHDARNPKGIATYMAERGVLANTPAGPRLIMYKGNAQWVEGGEGRLKILDFEKHTFDLGQFDKQRDPLAREASEQYISELLNPPKTVNDKQRRKYFSEAHNRLTGPLYCMVFALIGVVALIGGNFNRRGYAGRIAMAMGAVLAARLPGFAFQQLTNSSPDAVPLMYIWPLLWIVGLILFLSFPQILRRGTMANALPAGAQQ
ncbi:MAG: LPS export ABC transporter permease LptF [Alphaproteobacteria bacterium]|jgi:lipopolysaccharide export system permease protein|nr:LPS export ABC transporter permease LptF [Alphaproteobacteria bacterium]